MADSKNKDKDKDSDERSPTFTRALLGRVLAVGIFVVLGTFAVASSMNRGDKTDDQVVSVDEAEAGTDVTEATAETAQPASLVAKPPTKPIVQGKFQATTIPASSNRFATKPVASSPKVPAVNTSFARKPFSTAQSPAKSNASSPSSFGARPTPPPIKPVQANFTPSSQNSSTANNRPPSIRSGFDAFKTKVVKTTNDLADKATATARDTANKSGDAIDRGLGGLNVLAASGPSAKPTPTPKPPLRPSFDRGRLAASPAVKPASSRSFGKPSASERKPAVAFDTSRNLKPVSRQNGSRNTSISRSDSLGGSSSRTSFGASSKGGTSSFGSPVNQKQRNSPSKPVVSASSRPVAPASKPRSFERTANSSSNRPVARTIVAATDSAPISGTVRTSDAPGDRELEGLQAPALTVEKLSPREIQVNREAEFAIVVRNVGRVMAKDVRVFDEVPAGTEFLNSVPEASRSGQRLDWKIGELRPGQEKRITVQLKPTRPGEIGSVAHVTFATQATMRTRVTKPVLEIRHSTKPQALIGDPVVFDVVIENKGDGPATNVIVQEDVPEQLEYADGFRELEYEIGTLMPGQSKRVRLGLKAAQIGRLRNVMFASATGGLRAKHEIDMEVVAPKLVTTTEGATRRFLQRNVTHDFNVENNGTAKATNVELIARLPSGLRYVSANNQGRYDRNSHAVYWSLSELQPSIKAGVSLETMPVEVGKQDIKFEAFADLNQKSNATQPLSVEHLVDVFFDIDDVVDPIEIGSDTSYRIRIVNQGTKTAANVKLQVDFPNGMQPTGVEGNLRNEVRGQQVLFAPISTLPPGDEISVVVRSKGTAAGDHRVSVSLHTDGRQTEVTKEETTRVYADR